MNQQLIIYAKSPVPGHAKTRLGKGIGSDAAAGVYARLLYSYLGDLTNNLKPIDFDVTLSLASPEDTSFFAAAFPEFKVCAQCEGDLGERMQNSFSIAFASQTNRAILTGSDIPGMNYYLIQHAFSLLDHCDIVIGPAVDGGYYLVGMNQPSYPIFQDIHWSTNTVLDETRQRINALKRTVKFLPEKSDLDTARDYQDWRNAHAHPQEERK